MDASETAQAVRELLRYTLEVSLESGTRRRTKSVACCGGGNGSDKLLQLRLSTLQDFEVKGGKVTVPVGCNGLEAWLLDNVDVQKLLTLLRSGA